MKTPLAPQVLQKTMTADEVMRIRMRYNKALRAGMSIAEATAYANSPDLADPPVPPLLRSSWLPRRRPLMAAVVPICPVIGSRLRRQLRF